MENEDKQHLIGIQLDEFRTKLYKMSNEFLFSCVGKLYMFEVSCTIVENGDLKFFAILVVFLEQKKLVNSKYLSAWMTIAIHKHYENIILWMYKCFPSKIWILSDTKCHFQYTTQYIEAQTTLLYIFCIQNNILDVAQYYLTFNTFLHVNPFLFSVYSNDAVTGFEEIQEKRPDGSKFCTMVFKLLKSKPMHNFFCIDPRQVLLSQKLLYNEQYDKIPKTYIDIVGLTHGPMFCYDLWIKSKLFDFTNSSASCEDLNEKLQKIFEEHQNDVLKIY